MYKQKSNMEDKLTKQKPFTLQPIPRVCPTLFVDFWAVDNFGIVWELSRSPELNIEPKDLQS